MFPFQVRHTKEIMTDHGYINSYTPPEYEPYQQYQQYPSEDERVSNIANNQSTHGEQEDKSITYEKVGEIVEEGDDETEEDTTLEECGELYIAKEIETPHEEEFPQEWSDTEEAETVDNQEVMMMAGKKERLPSKEKSIEQKREKVSRAEIDRVIDETYALLNKPRLGRIWTLHQLYFKFMEFLPKRRITKDDVLSVSFHQP